MPNEAEVYCLLKLFAQLGYTVWFVRDGCLITVDHQILNGTSQYILQPSRASGHDVSAIEKTNQNIFAYVCETLLVMNAS